MSKYLAENIGIWIVLQQHRGGARVVVPRGDVQRGEAHLALGAIVDEQRHDILMALLEGHCQGGEAILREDGGEEGGGEKGES